MPLLALICAVVCVHNIDRVGFSILLDGIGKELSLSDFELGFLAGPAFALLNAGAALPIAWAADRFGRARMLSGCVFAWSALTSLTGLGRGFLSLSALRALVGLADAGATPISQAIAATQSPTGPERSAALSALGAAAYLGTVLGFAGAGLLAAWAGWRVATAVLGLPGMLLAVLVWRAGGKDTRASPLWPTRPPMGAAVQAAIRQPVFLHAAMVLASNSILGWAAVAWLPSFYIRSFGMRTDEVGFWLAGALGVAAALGAISGGVAARGWERHSAFPGLNAALAGAALSAPLLTVCVLTHSKALSLECLVASAACGAVCLGPVLGVIQSVATAGTRSILAAVVNAGVVLLGHACGPLLVGVISDVSQRSFGGESLRFSLAIASLLGIWPVIHLIILLRYGRRILVLRTMS